MTPSPEFIVRAYYLAWTDQDFERAISYMSPDVRWTMHIDPDIVSFAGQSAGRQAILERMRGYAQHFELIGFKILSLAVEAETVRAFVHGDYRHIASGQVLDLAIRHVFTLADHHIAACDEYQDGGRIRAFMALVSPPSKTTF